MFLSEDWLEVVRIGRGIVAIPLFWVDPQIPSKMVWFRAKVSGAKADNHIKGRQILGPPSLLTGEEFCHGKVLKVLVVGNYVDVF